MSTGFPQLPIAEDDPRVAMIRIGSGTVARPGVTPAARRRFGSAPATKSPSPPNEPGRHARQRTDDHAGGQGIGVAGVPEGQGPRLSPRIVDDPASRTHARAHGPAEGHACLANLAQGTVCKILDQEEVKPHKVRHGTVSLLYRPRHRQGLCAGQGSPSQTNR